MNVALMISGAQVRAVREALGLNHAEFAERVGISAETVRAIEKGAERVSRVVENAIRFIILTDGPDLGDPCADCQGRGTIRLPGRIEQHPFTIVRCPDCRGLGAFGYDCRVIV